jgi:hypothetical protein
MEDTPPTPSLEEEPTLPPAEPAAARIRRGRLISGLGWLAVAWLILANDNNCARVMGIFSEARDALPSLQLPALPPLPSSAGGWATLLVILLGGAYQLIGANDASVRAWLIILATSQDAVEFKLQRRGFKMLWVTLTWRAISARPYAWDAADARSRARVEDLAAHIDAVVGGNACNDNNCLRCRPEGHAAVLQRNGRARQILLATP